MFKQISWLAVICALLGGAYVQETGRDIPYVSPVVRTCAQSVRTYWREYVGAVSSRPAAQESQPGQKGVKKPDQAGAHESKASSLRTGAPRAFAPQSQVTESGAVIRILSDDNKGSRHQRFIVQLDSGQTLLIAHNIDLAPRIDSLRTGDTVSFCGEYAPNAKGGVIHWTHHDPHGRHPAGWIRHGGRTYQ